MALLPIYIKYEFLNDLVNTKVNLIDIDALSENKSKIEIIQLILNGAIISIDKTIEEFEALINESSNPILTYLLTNGNGRRRLNFMKEDFDKISSENFSTISKEPFTQFFLTNHYSGIADKIENENGSLVYTFNRANSIKRINQLNIDVFQNGDNVDWNFINKYSIPHHSIIIADPYLLSENPNHISDLISKFIGKDLKCKYHVTLFFRAKDHSVNKRYSDKCKEKVEERIELLKKKLDRISSPNIILEWVVYEGNDFHDRYIITNNFIIYTGNSFEWVGKQQEGKNTNWIVVNHSKMNDNTGFCYYNKAAKYLNGLKKWVLKKENYSSISINNPMLIN